MRIEDDEKGGNYCGPYSGGAPIPSAEEVFKINLSRSKKTKNASGSFFDKKCFANS